MSTDHRASRRLELTLRKPWFALYARIKPTLVMDGRGQPTQWGLGTWQVPADRTVVIGVFLFNRLWRFGQAEFALEPDHAPSLVYRAPTLPFLRGRIRLDPDANTPAKNTPAKNTPTKNSPTKNSPIENPPA